MTKGWLALAASGLLLAIDAQAASIDRRERRQAYRIREGVRSGELTRRETALLAANQAHVRAEEWRYRHDDGYLGPGERIDLRRDLNRSSRRIFEQKHDGQSR